MENGCRTNRSLSKNRRVIIETKTFGRLSKGPDIPRTGSREDETAFE